VGRGDRLASVETLQLDDCMTRLYKYYTCIIKRNDECTLFLMFLCTPNLKPMSNLLSGLEKAHDFSRECPWQVCCSDYPRSNK
jgi:hypothetical protein